MPDPAAQRYSVMLNRLIGSGQWERAASTARDWLAEDPQSRTAHRAAAQAYVNLRRHRDALPHLDATLAASPGDAFAHRLASIAHLALHSFARADDHLQQALALQPQDAANWFHLARMRYEQGAISVAARHARHALSLEPENAATINLLALCEEPASPARMAQYRRALALEPENAVVHNNVGVYHLRHSEHAVATEAFRKALSIDPTDRLAQENLLVALRQQDPFYRMLHFPGAFFPILLLNRHRQGAESIFYLCVAWVLTGFFWVPIYGFWLAFGTPLFIAYDHLTRPDLRERAGVVGARRGGPLRFWRWPRLVRVALLLIVYVFYSAAVFRVLGHPGRWYEWFFYLGLAGLAVEAVYVLSGKARRRFAVWRSERRLRRAAARNFSPSSPS